MKLKSVEKFDRQLDTVRIGRNICFGGGGSSAPSSTTNTTSNIPAYLEPYVTRNVAAAEGVANQPYQAYGGDRLAGFNQNQQQNQAAVMGMQTPGQYSQATNATNAAMNNGSVNSALGGMQGALNAPGQWNNAIAGTNNALNNSQVNSAMGGIQGALNDPGQWGNAINGTQYAMGGSWADPNTAAQYMNPYAQNVTDIANREAFRNYGIQQTASDAQFAKSGAFGGSRQGISDAEARRNLMQQQSNNTMTGLNNAYNTGMGQFNAEQAKIMQGAGQLGNLTQQQSAQQLAGYGQLGNLGLQEQSQQLAGANQLANIGQNQTAQQLQGYGQMGTLGAQEQGLQLQGANQLASIGGQQQAADLARLQAQKDVGAQQQQNTQQGLDLAYQDFLNQRDYGKNQAAWLTGIYGGTVAPVSTSQQTMLPSANVGSQIAGLGIAGLGASQMGK